jgi:hypothetical protein
MLKLTHKILIGGLLLLTSCGQATGSEKKDAIAALQALNAKTDTGITFPSYVDELGKAKIVVEKYKVDGKQKQSGAANLEIALDAHISAANLWGCSIQSRTDGFLRQCQTQELKGTRNQHPSIRPYVNELEKEVSPGFAFQHVDQNKALSLLWAEAKDSVTKVK